MNLKTPALTLSAAGVAGVARAAFRYAAAYASAERQWLRWTGERLSDIGEVDAVTVLPLVERLTTRARLRGEPGVSYLVTAGTTKLLFDTGLNMRREVDCALVHNAAELAADLSALDAVVISHLHADHVGGPGRQLRRTFGFSRQPLEPRGIPAHVPAPMAHDRAETILTTAPKVIAPGVAVLPPLPRALFWMGPIEEQAMVVNVRGFGLVLFSGCGHPPIERTLAATERVLDVPVKGVVGGLHLPVHPLGTPLIPQAVLGSPHPPWRLVDERDAVAVMDAIGERGPRVVALSGHDSTQWTYDRFAERFDGSFRLLRVGEQLHISASGADLTERPAGQSVRTPAAPPAIP